MYKKYIFALLILQTSAQPFNATLTVTSSAGAIKIHTLLTITQTLQEKKDPSRAPLLTNEQKLVYRTSAKKLMNLYRYVKDRILNKIDEESQRWSWIPHEKIFNRQVIDAVAEDLDDLDDLINEYLQTIFNKQIRLEIAALLNSIQDDFCKRYNQEYLETPQQWKEFLTYQEDRLYNYFQQLLFDEIIENIQ